MFEDTDIEDLTEIRNENDQFVNQRRTVRYIRKDIAASIYKNNWLSEIGLTWFRNEIPVELLDVSSRGCLIDSDETLAVDAKVVVVLKFAIGKSFEINATVVRKAEGRDREYGIKFVEYNNELGEYMLEMQSELLFK
jgi:hypothetical protein